MIKFKEIEKRKIRHNKFGQGIIKNVCIDETDGIYSIDIIVEFENAIKRFVIGALGKQLFFIDSNENEEAGYIKMWENINVQNKEKMEKQERLKIIKKRNIQNLVHFTNIKNLASVLLCEALLSVDELQKNNIKYFRTDSNRYDEQLEYISTSVSFPNYKMLYKKQNELPNYNWIIFLIDPKILIDKLDTLFVSNNSASSEIKSKLIENKEYFLTAEAFEDMFKNYITNNQFVKGRDVVLPTEYATDSQAEVMIKDKVELKYIKGIIVKDQKSWYEVKNIVKNKIDVIIDESMFSYRQDYNYSIF